MCLVFRGTESARDVIIDLNIFRTSHYINNKYIGKVHTGFLNQYNEIKDKIFNHLDSIKFNNNNNSDSDSDSNSTLFICAHSLGSGLGSLSCLSLLEKYPDINIKNYTFGSPRIGNSDFIYNFNKLVKNNYRIINNNDPVTLIPSILLYRHTQGEI